MSWVTKQIKPNSGKENTPNAALHLDDRYGLSMYREPPTGEVTLEEVERVALDRLKVLKGIEEARLLGGDAAQQSSRMQETIKTLLAEHMEVKGLGGKGKGGQYGWKDALSHHVLRLAYCRTEDLRRWFLQQESELFKYKFTEQLSDVKVRFMQDNGLPYDVMTEEQYRRLHRDLIAVALSRYEPHVAQSLAELDPAGGPAAIAQGCAMFFQVPFEQVPDLVSTRRVLIQDGVALVGRSDVTSLVVQHFRAQLSKSLAITARRWQAHLAEAEKDRLTPIIEGLSNRYLGPEYGGAAEGAQAAVSAAAVATLAPQSFPLCMFNLYNHLHTEHHLRHSGRQQLGLFLKGIGLPLEEALRFWKAEFAPRVPGDKFDKEYAYNVRHAYGKEGKKANYTPWGCLKIVQMTPNQGEYHGCPYKVWTAAALRQGLQALQVPGPNIEAAVSKAGAGHYQLACAAVWEGKHGCACTSGISHPNQYFEESMRVRKEKEGAAVATKPAAGAVKLESSSTGEPGNREQAVQPMDTS